MYELLINVAIEGGKICIDVCIRALLTKFATIYNYEY